MNKIFTVIIIAIIAIVAFLLINNNTDNTNDAGDATASQNQNTHSTAGQEAVDPDFDGVTTSVKIALLDNEGISGGKMRGCDRVVLVDRTVSPTEAPLTTALQTLFALNEEKINGWQNFIARTNDTLTFDHVSLANGIASIYLTGSLSGLAGVCDDPRAKIQIEETALQFPSVSSVVIYLNNQITTLQPNESGQ